MDIFKVVGLIAGIIGGLILYSGIYTIRSGKYTKYSRGTAGTLSTEGVILEGRAAVLYGFRFVAGGVLLLLVAIVLLFGMTAETARLVGGLFGLISGALLIFFGVQGVIRKEFAFVLTRYSNPYRGVSGETAYARRTQQNVTATGIRAILMGAGFTGIGLACILFTLSLVTDVGFFRDAGASMGIVLVVAGLLLTTLGNVLRG